MRLDSAIEMSRVGLAVAAVVGIGHGEQAVVEAHFGGDRVPRADPVDRALDLAIGARHAVTRRRVERAAHFADRAVGVLDDLLAAHDADAAQAHFAARHEAMEALRRHLREIVALDPELARERHVPRAECLVLRMIGELERSLRAPSGRFVITSFSGSSTAMRRGASASSSSRTQPSSTLNSITRILLGDAGALPERADRRRRKTAAAQADERRHARIVPAVDEACPARAPSACACSSPCSRDCRARTRSAAAGSASPARPARRSGATSSAWSSRSS